MAKRRKVIKRVYERGRETTISSAMKKAAKSATPRKDIKRVVSRTMPPRSATQRITRETEPRKRETKPREQVVTRKREVPISVSAPQLWERQNLPSTYKTTRLSLLAKDPFWIYAYWELDPDYRSQLSDRLNDRERDTSTLVLRMYDVTLVSFNGVNANTWFDIDVGDHAQSWYVNLWKDNVSYMAELGLRTGEGHFYPIVRSNHVHTPRSQLSPRTEQIWMTVHEKPHLELERRIYAYLEKSSRTRAEASKKRPQQSAPAVRQRRVFYLSEDDIRNFYAELSPRLREVMTDRLSDYYGEKAVTGDSSRGYRLALDGESYNALVMIHGRDFVRRLLKGASEELVVSEGGSEQLVTGGSSDFAARRIGARSFFFDIWAELIVYGRTEPDAAVRMNGNAVQLRPDGTFTMRFGLPDGRIPMRFDATSNDRVETRRISTTVTRATTRDT